MKNKQKHDIQITKDLANELLIKLKDQTPLQTSVSEKGQFENDRVNTFYIEKDSISFQVTIMESRTVIKIIGLNFSSKALESLYQLIIKENQNFLIIILDENNKNAGLVVLSDDNKDAREVIQQEFGHLGFKCQGSKSRAQFFAKDVDSELIQEVWKTSISDGKK